MHSAFSLGDCKMATRVFGRAATQKFTPPHERLEELCNYNLKQHRDEFHFSSVVGDLLRACLSHIFIKVTSVGSNFVFSFQKAKE